MYSILIVDDSALIRSSLSSYFQQNKSWRVCGEAADGKEALDKAKQLKPDLVVLDLLMPVMNGIEAARELKRISPSVPLVMFTNIESRFVEKDAIAAGCDCVISKSERFQVLLDSMHRLLSAPKPAPLVAVPGE